MSGPRPKTLTSNPLSRTPTTSRETPSSETTVPTTFGIAAESPPPEVVAEHRDLAFP